MPIEFTAPPKDRPLRGPDGIGRRSYTEFLLNVREAAGGWVSLPLGEVTGRTNNDKQIGIVKCAQFRGFKAQTTVQQGRIYVRFVRDIAQAV